MTDFSFYTNERFRQSFNLTNQALLYDLSAGEFLMQLRKSASSPLVVAEFKTGGSPGIMTYDATAKLLSAYSPSAYVLPLAGDYYYDYGFTPSGGEFIRFDGGKVTAMVGVSRKN